MTGGLVDFDRNQFLQDVYEHLLALPADPVLLFDAAIFSVIGAHARVLRDLAQAHRKDLLDMVAEHRRTGKPVATKWKA